MRKSSVHFKQVANASVSIAHSTRTEETEPAYLLPKEHRLGNVIVPGSMSNIELGLEFTRAKSSMTGQAKARGSSPFWEGVVVLDGTDLKAQTAKLQGWKKEYEKATGHRVLHMAIHGDEGFINSKGKPEYNMHAHVTVNRMNDKGRVIKLERKQLSAVQDLTAKSLGMQRGETLEERKGMRGRKHLNHREFKAQANEKRLDAEHNIGAIQTLKTDVDKSQSDLTRQRKLSKEWSDADLAKVKDLKAKLDGEPARLDAALKAQEAQLNEKYRLDRERMKQENAAALAAGVAKMYSQKDYSELKKAHEAALAEAAKVPALEAQVIQQTAAFESLKVEAMAVITPLRTEVKTMKTQITQLEADKAQLATEAAKWAAKAKEYQDAKAAGTPAHLIVPGEAPSTPTRGAKPGLSEGRQGVSTASLHGPRAIEQPKTPPEQPKTQNPDIPTTKPEKSLGEALRASWDAMLEWVKSLGGTVEQVQDGRDYYGAVKHLDDLHAVQSTGRGKHVIHELSKLDQVPDMDNPKMEIRYRGGVGQVVGNQEVHRPRGPTPGR